MIDNFLYAKEVLKNSTLTKILKGVGNNIVKTDPIAHMDLIQFSNRYAKIYVSIIQKN